VLASIIVYAPVRSHEFVNFDDLQYVADNSHVTGGLTWQGVGWAFTTNHEGNWHPLTWMSHMVDVSLFGVSAGPHHLTSVALHILNTLLLFWLLRRMTGAPGRSAFVAGLFAVHPLHAESVAWIAERKDVLSTLFWLLTVGSYLRFVQHPRPRRFLLVIACFALGLLSKPMVVTLPFVLLLLDFWPLGRATTWRGARALVAEKVPLLVLAAASSVVTFVVQAHGGAVKALDALPISDRIANALLAYVVYIGKMVWPARLAAIYPYPRYFPPWELITALVALCAITVVTVRAARSHPDLPVGWLWYLGTLVPVIGLVQVGSQPFADRYTYIPVIGLFIVVAWGSAEALPHFRFKRVALPTAAAVVIGVLAVTARAQVETWRNSVALWQHALEVTSGNYRAESNLGHALAGLGRTGDAIAHYSRALLINPAYPDAHNNLGIALEGTGHVDDAIAHYAEALRVNPQYVDAHNNVGVALTTRGEADDAIRHFSEALRLEPDRADVINNLGVALLRKGEPGEAARQFRAALQLNPSYADAHRNLGLTLVDQGEAAVGIVELSEAARLSPGDPLVHNGLGRALEDQGRVDAAIVQYAESVRLNRDFADAHINLGRALAGAGRIDEAIREFREAVRLKPDDADAHYDLGVVLAKHGQVAEAIQQVSAAVTINPGHSEARRLLDGLRRLRK
jgi:tetratricopeptide (TPR) repeat protein